MTHELDKISQLPGYLTDQILSCLPIKDAVRTSILSREWRYKWSSLPQLVFDDQCTSAREVPYLQPSPHDNLVKIIDKVLLLHAGPIQKFKLSHRAFHATSDIDQWILHLSRVSVKEIVLDIWDGQKYKIPTSLFNCHDLVHLKLYRCLVKIPSTFQGFKNLESLDLQSVELSSDGLEVMISRCPLLKHLKVKNIQGITRVNVKARNLERLFLGGRFQDFAFDDLNCLKLVTVNYDEVFYKLKPGFTRQINLCKFFQNLPNTQSLKLENYSLKYLAIGNVAHKLPYHCTLVHLKYLFTCIDFNRKEEISTVICLIRSSPQLKEVELQCRAKDQQTTWIRTMADFWEDKSCCLEQVQVVSMGGISGNDPELGLMKFLLTSSSNLKTMRIRPNSTSREGKLLRELLRFRRASAQAEVIFLDPVNPE